MKGSWRRPVLLMFMIVAALAAIAFGLRTYCSFVLLRSAYAGPPLR